METPVIFIIYNRPQTTARVFEAIRQVKPRQLLVIADGPRSDRPSDRERCQAARQIVEQANWDCEILRNYSAVNLGCRQRISSGLNWAFARVESAVILEDDCIPDLTFFPFCEELLKRYDRDPRVMAISGDNFQFGRRYTADSYYFSRYPHCWGWATWRRAWQQYDDSMSSWPQLRDSRWLETLFSEPEAVKYWSNIFENNYRGFNSWAYVWTLTCWSRNGLTILPEVNLVSNIGFDRGATHTPEPSQFAHMETGTMTFPMRHPQAVKAHLKADEFTEKIMFSGQQNAMSMIGKNTTCKVCGSTSQFFDRAQILNKYDVDYFQCINCGFVQTEDPDWLAEAYAEPIADSDVGLVARNLEFSQIAENLIVNLFDRRGKFLDYGCGYGLFVRLMRESGFDFYGCDRYCQNLFYQGFEVGENSDDNYDLVTAFEVLEHLVNPREEIEKILKFSRSLFFSTQLLPENNPKPKDWWYYALSEGQHISIYTKKALSIIAERFGLNLYTYGNSLHLLTEKVISPHLFYQSCQVKHSSQSGRRTEADYLREISLAKKAADRQNKSFQILVDGVFFQLNNTGIARVWRSLFSAWVADGFASHILVLDREGTTPKIPGIRYRTIPRYNSNDTERDRQMLQRVCDEQKADLFISTYYTTPVSTPSVLMAYDMIPEVFGQNLNCPEWREKHEGIRRAVSYLTISENTARDLIRYFPQISPDSVTIAHCGVESQFSPASDEEKANFRCKYGLSKSYFLIVGERVGWKNAKNTILFFQAFSRLANNRDLEIVCVGGKPTLEKGLAQFVSERSVKILTLSDAELKVAYSSAIALVYPSKYEGFGMPIAEAMACGCPVITCPNSSLLEVAGEAAIYVGDRDIDRLVQALIDVQKSDIRQKLIVAGLEQSRQFSWSKMGKTVGNALLQKAAQIKSNSRLYPRVSAIVSTYNSEKFLRGCLEDLTNQTLYQKGELEIIIIDSKSEQNEKQIVSEFQSQYPQIVYHQTENRETLYAAWNRAIALAKGDYITNANTDDRHRKDALEVMADYLDKNQNVAIVYGDQLITRNDNETFDNTQANRRWNWPEFSYEELERRCILGPQPMWRKSLHEKYGDFRSEFEVAGDYEFWLRVGKTEKIVKLPQVFGLYYEHPQGLEKTSPTMVQEVRQIWHEYGISQRGIQPKTSVPVPVSPSELDSMRAGTPTTPQISIIIPCYNQANYLKEAVDSLLAQTIADWECIIVNDGSSDGTPVVAELLIELHRDRALKLINQDNKGVVAARNLGLSQARGNYLLFLDADDKLHPNFLAETLEILQQKPDVGFVYTDIEYFGTQQGVKTDGDFDPSRLLRSNQASITSLFRRSICDRIGGLKTEMEAGLEDWEFWVAAYESGWRGYRLPKPYLYYRQYGDGSRLQNLLGDRETLAVQKAKIIALHPNLYTPEEVGAAAQILQERGIVIHPVRSASNIVSNPDQFLADVTDLVERYNRGSGDRTVLDRLRQLRRELAEFWWNCEPESLESARAGAPGKAHKLLLKSGLKQEVKTESEIQYGRTLQTAIADNYSHGTAIAAMLYFWPHQLSIPYEKLALPQWLAADYLDFLLSNPEFFQEVGEADGYRQYFLGLLRYLHRSIFANKDSQNWKNIAWFVTIHCRVISLYFNTENLKEIYTLRGDIIEFALRSRGAQIDWEIPQRSADRQKIRVGILSKHFGPMTETFATLPAFEYLDRGQFEVVLYALQTDGNSVEQYCRDRADKFVQLSGSLMAQVTAIRGDELDVLLVGTNVTAVTHEITLIACHRLARVQLTCFNSPVTTGFKNIDFYIAGELMELPKNGSDHYREKLVKIPGAGCCFSYTVEPQKSAPPPQRQQLGIPDDAIAFVSGANLYKLTPELRETWVKILAAVPHSNLLVLPFGASWTHQYPEVAFRQQMQALLNRHNIDPKRLKILGALPNRAQVKAVLQLGDIYLDSFPYAGTTSLVDPLEVGLPVVVWEGNTLRSRMGAAMVRSLLPNEPIPASEPAYIDAAVQLATDVGGRQRKSQEIREQMAANPEFLDSRAHAVKMGAVFAQLFQLRRRQEEATALEKPAVRQQFLAELVDWVNLYDLDPTNREVVEKLRHTRRVMAEYWLNQPPEKLETLYQQPIGKGYQILLNRGIQKEPLTDSEQVLVNQLAKVATGLAQPNSINSLMVVMLYSQPGKMFVRDALKRLPGWLYPDYQRIFENSEAIAQIQRAVTAQQQPTPGKAEELPPEAMPLENSQLINRARGCAKLFQIDPTDADIAAELRQLRWQIAHFWLNLPEEILETTYDRDMGDAFRALLHSRLQNERLTQQEWDFLQTLATYLRQGLDAPRSIHHLMAAMLYYRPEQVQIQNPSRLPNRLRRDYESWQNSQKN